LTFEGFSLAFSYLRLFSSVVALVMPARVKQGVGIFTPTCGVTGVGAPPVTLMKLFFPSVPFPPSCRDPTGVLTPHDDSPVFLFPQNAGLIGSNGTEKHFVPSGDTETGPAFTEPVSFGFSAACEAEIIAATANTIASPIEAFMLIDSFQSCLHFALKVAVAPQIDFYFG